MRIIALSTSAYPPESSPMSHRLHCYMLALKETGHDVVVYNISSKAKKGTYQGIEYNSLNSNEFGVPLNKLNWCLIRRLFKILNNTDILFHSEDGICSILLIELIARLRGVKTLLELNEYPYGFKVRRLETAAQRWLKQKVYFNFVLPRLSGLFVISKSLEDLVKGRNSKVIRIPVLSKQLYIERGLNNVEVPYIFHAGALSESKDGIKCMLEAFNVARKRLNGELNFVLTQNTSLPNLRRWISEFIKANELEDSVIFTGTICKEELESYYRSCALAIINKPLNTQNLYNFPTKLTELIPRGIPLIISKSGELNEFFKDGYNAVMVEPNNVSEVADAILKLIQNPDFSQKIVSNAFATNEEYFYYKNHRTALDFFITGL